MNNELTISHLARKVMLRKTIARAVAMCILVIVSLMAVAYAVGSIAELSGKFQIQAFGKGDAVISLSDTADFAEPSTMLESESLDDMTNISGRLHLPDDIDQIDGSHNGENYFAHTFYLKNAGGKTADVAYTIDILGKLKNADKATWVRVYVNGDPITYACPKDDGTAEFGTEAFFSEDKVLSKTLEDLEPGETVKFTVVVWLEGDDPDCVNAIMGGYARFAMEFKVLSTEE